MELDWYKDMEITAEAHMLLIDDEFIPYWILWEDNGATYRAALPK